MTKPDIHHVNGPVAFLSGEYPKVSHTFIQREIVGLRAQGLNVLTCTVRRAPSKDVVGADQLAEQAATFCVIEAAKSPLRLIAAHLKVMKRFPQCWFSALNLAWKTRPPGMKALLWQMFYFAEAGVLAAHLRDKGVVHLHNHFGNSSCSVAMLAAQMAGLPFSYTMHGPSEFFEPMHWRIDEKIARAAFVACISHFARAQGMIFADQAHWSRMRIVHCGVEPTRYGRALRREAGKHMLFVGRLAAVKGVVLLLEAFAALRRDHPDATLTLVGDGSERAALEARAQALELGEAVTFTGYLGQDAVAGQLDIADIFVLPSFAEGVPVVLMEAMASRIPVIGPRVAGVQELVEDGVNGYTVPPGDLETLTSRIGALLTNTTLRTRMGKAGRAKVEAEFDVNQEAEWLAALLRGSMVEALPDGLRPGRY